MNRKLRGLIGFGIYVGFFALLATTGLWGPAPKEAQAGGAQTFTIGASTPAATNVLVSTSPNSTLYAVVITSAATSGDFVKCFSSGAASGFVAGSEVGSASTNVMLANVVASTGPITAGTAPTEKTGSFGNFGVNAPLGIVCFRSAASTVATVYYLDR